MSCLQMSMDHLLSAGYLVESGVSSTSFSTHLLTFRYSLTVPTTTSFFLHHTATSAS